MLRSAAPLGTGVLGQLSKTFAQRAGPSQVHQGRILFLPSTLRTGSTGPSSAVHEDVMQLKSDEEVKAALESLGPHGVAIVDFTAVWCPPCKIIAPVYAQLAAANPAISFFKIDIDGEAVRGTVQELGITSVPTFVSYRGTRQLDRFSGADRAALQGMVAALASAAVL